MSGSDSVLLAEMAAFWVLYDAAGTDEERGALLRKWHLAHGGRIAKGHDSSGNRPGDLTTGLHPIRV